MIICRLCQNREADETGSHLIPHFLLKRVVNADGKGGRDQEMGFRIDSTNSSSNFGRSVNVDKLKKMYGELSENDISKNIDPNVEDYIFCKSCEKRLATIENNYAPSVHNSKAPSFKGGRDGAHAFLFWTSIFWRMSTSRRYGQFLSDDQEEKLRNLLDDLLDEEISSVPKSFTTKQVDEFKVSYKVLRSPDFSKENATHVLFHPEFFAPYSLLIDEFLIVLSFDGNYSDYDENDFFGIKHEIVMAPINVGIESEQIAVLENETFKHACNGVIDKMKSLRVAFIDKVVHAIAHDLGYGDQMPIELKKLIYSQITLDTKPLGRKYTFEDMKQSIIDVLKEHPPQ